MSDSWNPQQYLKFKNERSQPYFDLIALVRSKPEAEVIDLGCGTGELTAELHRHLQAKRTVGLDSSGEMLKKSAAFQTEGLQFQRGDIHTWHAPKTFDLVFSNAALQWCEDHPTLFRNIKDALRPGGQLAIQMPMNHDYPTHVLASRMSTEEPWCSLLKGAKYDKTVMMLLPEQYAQLLFDLGFAEQHVSMRVYGHVLDSREDVVEWVKGTLLTHFRSRLEPNDYQKFLAEFRERLFEQLKDDRPFFYPFKRLLLWARLP